MKDCSSNKSRPARSSANWREHLIAITIFSIASCLFIYPVFSHFNNWGRMDWPQFYTWYDVSRTTILKYKQLPLWNPYSWGGNLALGHTHEGSLSPFFPLVLLFGVVKGLKIWMLVSIILGGWGMWALVRSFGAGRISSYFAAFVWAFNGWFSMHFAVGHIDTFTLPLLPWLYLFYLKSLGNFRYALPSALILLLMAFSGNPYPFTFAVLFLGFHSLISAGFKQSLVPLKRLVLILGICFFLGAVKFFPILDMMAHGVPVEKDWVTGTHIYELWQGLISRGQVLHGRMGNYGTWEFAAYIGYLPLGIFTLALVDGLIKSIRKRVETRNIFADARLFSSTKELQSEKWALAATSGLFFLLALGDKAPVDLLGALKSLPGLRSYHIPFRLIIVSIFAFCPWLGSFLTRWELPKKRLLHKALLFLLSFILLADLISQNSPHFGDIFVVQPPDISAGRAYITDPAVVKRHNWAKEVPFLVADAGERSSRKFFQKYVEVNSARLSYFAQLDIQSWALVMYLNFLQNVGTLNSYDPVHLTQFALGKEDRGYKGEAYILSGQGTAEIIKFSPNKFTVKTSTNGPDRLIINQNFHPGWRVKPGRVEPWWGGLISTKIPVGEHIITLYFLPLSFILGLILSLVTCGGLILLFIRSK